MTGDCADMLWLDPLLLCTLEVPAKLCPADARLAGMTVLPGSGEKVANVLEAQAG